MTDLVSRRILQTLREESGIRIAYVTYRRVDWNPEEAGGDEGER
jgi:hypothetical protein